MPDVGSTGDIANGNGSSSARLRLCRCYPHLISTCSDGSGGNGKDGEAYFSDASHNASGSVEGNQDGNEDADDADC